MGLVAIVALALILTINGRCDNSYKKEGFLIQGDPIRINALSKRVVELEQRVKELESQHLKDVATIKKLRAAKKITVTAYSGSKSECDNDPTVTASMSKLKPGIVAVSRDLFNQGWVFGRRVYIEGYGIYEIADLMSKKHKNRVDVFIGHKGRASKFGKKDLMVSLLPDKKS